MGREEKTAKGAPVDASNWTSSQNWTTARTTKKPHSNLHVHTGRWYQRDNPGPQNSTVGTTVGPQSPRCLTIVLQEYSRVRYGEKHHTMPLDVEMKLLRERHPKGDRFSPKNKTPKSSGTNVLHDVQKPMSKRKLAPPKWTHKGNHHNRKFFEWCDTTVESPSVVCSGKTLGKR